MKEKDRMITAYILTVLILGGGLGYYNHYTANTLKQDYSSKISLLNNAFASYADNNDQKLQAVDENIGEMKTAIEDQNAVFTSMVSNLEKESQLKIQNIISLVEKTEEENKLKLDILKEELQGEISNIKVKSADFSAIIDGVIRSVVSVVTDAGQGSGSFISDEGYIITNKHVIDNARTLRVVTFDRLIHNAEIVGVHTSSDIAVLKIASANYSSLRFDPYSDVKVGEKVIAVGNPGGFDFTVTEGIISALDRQAAEGMVYIQTDVPINPGNSGGPLINTRGRIIGINNFKIKGFEGIGFALNPDTAEQVSEAIIEQFG